MLSAIRQQFYSNELKKLKGDTKQLYKLVAKLTGNIKKNNLPDQAKSCEQDQIPTKIVKSRIDTFIKPYTKLKNLSMIYGQFDDSWKSAIL